MASFPKVLILPLYLLVNVLQIVTLFIKYTEGQLSLSDWKRKTFVDMYVIINVKSQQSRTHTHKKGLLIVIEKSNLSL